MSLEIVCSNTAPLWHLGRVKEEYKVRSLELIKEVYGKIYVPKAVVSELGIRFKVDGTISFIGGYAPQSARNYVLAETKIMGVNDTSLVENLMKQYRLGRGECETLVLAKELGIAECLLANDGAEEMFDKEKQSYKNIVPFIDFCFQQGVTNKAETYSYLKALWDIGYKEKKYLSVFNKYGIGIKQ
jgi:predicted nucleic acid-binding protein